MILKNVPTAGVMQIRTPVCNWEKLNCNKKPLMVQWWLVGRRVEFMELKGKNSAWADFLPWGPSKACLRRAGSWRGPKGAGEPPSDNWHLCALPRYWRCQTLHSSFSWPCPLVTSQGSQSSLTHRQIWQPLVWCDLCRGERFLAGMVTFQLVFFLQSKDSPRIPISNANGTGKGNRHSSVITTPQWEWVSSEFSKLNNQDLKSGTRT